jgi:hypothetical protein
MVDLDLPIKSFGNLALHGFRVTVAADLTACFHLSFDSEGERKLKNTVYSLFRVKLLFVFRRVANNCQLLTSWKVKGNVRKTVTGRNSTATFFALPCELLEEVAYRIDDGEDLIDWLNACDGSGAVMGDLKLITKLSEILGHDDIPLQQGLDVNAIFNREARFVIGKVSRFYSLIHFEIRCLRSLMSIELSKKPVVCLSLGNDHARQCVISYWPMML